MTFKRLSLVLVLVLVVVLVVSVQAQETQAPASIQFALDALSENLGVDVTLATISEYQWRGQLYPDTSLGCAQVGQTYTQTPTRGVQYLLTYGGTVYDYRVSTDGSIVILCEGDLVVQPESTAEATAEATAAASSSICGEPLDFSVGQTVNVVPLIGNVNVRDQASLTGAKVGQVTGGDTLTILGGPECGARGVVWWQVQAGDVQGWIAEGRAGLYFLEAPAEATPEATATAAPGA
jgi:hypothetical protein